MHKVPYYKLDAIKKVLVGINKAADAAKGTLGPKGCNTTYIGIGKRVISTKDGASILNELDSFKDPHENIGLMLVRQVTKHTVDTAGDGTTTATVLFQAMANQGARYREAGMLPTELANGMRFGVDEIIKYFRKESYSLHNEVNLDLNKIREVASISVNDKEMGRLIADLMYEIGEDGIVAVEDGRTFETTTEQLEGMKFDQGFRSAHFVTNKAKQVCEMENPHILVYSKKLDSRQHMLALRNIFENNVGDAPLLIIAEDISETVLTFLEINSFQKSIKVCAVKAPGFGDTRHELAIDIATFVGATYVGESANDTLEKFQPNYLGSARKVIVNDKSTTIISGKFDPEQLKERCDIIKHKLENETSDYAKTKLRERLGKLIGRAGIIRVGGKTETDQKELKDRIDDAVQAVKAAISGGILPGGGLMHVKASKVLHDKINEIKKHHKYMKNGKEVTCSTGFIWGVSTIAESLAAPLRQMLLNAGVEDSQVIVHNILKSTDKNSGYDVQNDEQCDLLAHGIIDPTECLVSALENAGYVAARFIETDCIIVEELDNNGKSGANSMMDMGY